MITPLQFVALADAFRLASGIERDTTLSHRIFGDTKKLAMLRAGGDLTLTRAADGLRYMAVNWPAGQALPDLLVQSVGGDPRSAKEAVE